ncbi:response regulator transcription factor [Bacillus sp. F19]|nr:response regulator transcription factor [Bacillus sp. F19]
MKKIRLLLVDDQELIRESLYIVLDMEPELEVIGLAENGQTAIELCEEQKPDVVLMDLHMPKVNGVEATEEIKRRWSDIRVIILTTFQEIDFVVDALAAGAEGYLLKAIHPKDLAAGIKWVFQGGTLIPQEIAQMLVRQLKNPLAVEASEKKSIPQYGLSEREVEILHCVSEGLNNREIAQRLFLSEGTVKNYVSSIYSKMGVRDRVQASMKAHQEGII